MQSGLKQFGGVWLPVGETHLTGWMQKMQQREDGRLCYQKTKLDAVLSLVTDFRVAIDIGAHCGLHSMRLAKRFGTVHAFEPVALHRDAFMLNVSSGQAVLHAMALGESDGMVSMKSEPASSGDTVVDGIGDIPMRRLDDVLPDIQGVGLIKLDCEGFELHALRGGEELLKRCRPAIMVEQKPGKAQSFGLSETGGVEYLKSLGAVLRKEMSGDFLMSW